MYKNFLGIDISKKTFDMALIDQNEKRIMQNKFSMTLESFKELESALFAYNKEELLIVLESTSSYHINLLGFLLENNYNVSVVQPMLINSFIKSLTLRKTKTDKKDAYYISLFGKSCFNNLKLATKKDIDALKMISREKEDIKKNCIKLINQIKTLINLLFPEITSYLDINSISMLSLFREYPSAKLISNCEIKEIKRLITSNRGFKLGISAEQILEIAKSSIGIHDKNLEYILRMKINRILSHRNELKALDKLINKHIKQDIELKKNIEILKSIDGIGDETSKSFILELVNITDFSSYKKLIAFIGTDPSIKQSGTSINVKGKISKRGNNHLRRTVYLMSLGVIKYNEVFNKYFVKKLNEGMPYRKAVIAVANKLIKLVFAMLKNNEFFKMERYRNSC